MITWALLFCPIVTYLEGVEWLLIKEHTISSIILGIFLFLLFIYIAVTLAAPLISKNLRKVKDEVSALLQTNGEAEFVRWSNALTLTIRLPNLK